MARRPDNSVIEPVRRRPAGSVGPTQSEADARHPEAIPDEHRASVLRGLADLRDGRIAAEADVEALYRRLSR